MDITEKLLESMRSTMYKTAMEYRSLGYGFAAAYFLIFKKAPRKL